MSNIVINPDDFQYYDAPLKTIDINGLIQFNKQLRDNKYYAVNTLAPHYYNKISYFYTKDDLYYPAFIVPNGKTYLTNAQTVMGISRYASSDGHLDDTPAILDDYAIYYKLDKISNLSWGGGVSKNALTAEVGLYVTNYYYGDSESIYTPTGEMGNIYSSGVLSPTHSEPQGTHGYNDWLYVSEWQVFNRKTGATTIRETLGVREDYNVFPCIVWDANDIYYYDASSGIPRARVENGEFQGFTILNFLGGASRNMMCLGDWKLLRSTTGKSGIAIPRTGDIILHHASLLGDGVKFLAGLPSNATWNEIIRVADISQSPIVYNYLYNCTNAQLQPRIAFKTEQDFLNLLADWGVKHVTDSLADAQTLPAELFPDYDPNGGFVPGGGDSSGYGNDTTINIIPSFPDNTSDTIELNNPNITSLNAASAYALNLLTVKDTLNWLMTDNFISNISNLFSDKLSAINDLKIMPFDIVAHDSGHTENSAELTLANVSTEIQCYKILPSYNCIIDGGTMSYTAYWGDYNDYTAATYQLYIPYGGVVELSPSHVVNCTLSLKYVVDLMTGNATAVIYSNGVLIKTIPCQLGQSVPITFTNTNQRDIKTALGALNMVNNIVGTVGNAAAGNVGGAISSGLGIVSNAADMVMNNPLKYSSVGGFASGTALLMPQTPFLIINRVQLSIPSNIPKMRGKPSNIYSTINSFVGSGYVEITVTHVNTTATTDEQRQIIDLLRGGIFI